MGGLSSRYQSYVWKLFFCSSNFWGKGWSCFSEIIFKYFTISPKANKSIEGKIDTAQARITASNKAVTLNLFIFYPDISYTIYNFLMRFSLCVFNLV